MITAFQRETTTAKRMPCALRSPSTATGLPLRGSSHSQKAMECPGAGSTMKRRVFQLVSVTALMRCSVSCSPQLRVIQSRATAWTASRPVTSTMISAEDGAIPSANSRFPSGARKETPRLNSSSQPRPPSNPSAEKKLASLTYASGVPAGRTIVIPLIILF